jgi:hypothetical protein
MSKEFFELRKAKAARWRSKVGTCDILQQQFAEVGNMVTIWQHLRFSPSWLPSWWYGSRRQQRFHWRR